MFMVDVYIIPLIVYSVQIGLNGFSRYTIGRSEEGLMVTNGNLIGAWKCLLGAWKCLLGEIYGKKM